MNKQKEKILKEFREVPKEFEQQVYKLVVGITGQYGKPIQQMREIEKGELQHQCEQLARALVYEVIKIKQQFLSKALDSMREETTEDVQSKTNELLEKIDKLLTDIGDETTSASFFIKKFRQIIKDNYYQQLKNQRRE